LLSDNREIYLSVRVYKLPNEPGSAGHESGEVTHTLYIAISEFDEYPDQSLFKIGPFYNPEFWEWV